MAENNDINWALADIKSRVATDVDYRGYYRGDQELSFASEMFKRAFGNNLKPIGINTCKTVVDTVAGRLRVEGFSAQTSGTDGSERLTDIIRAEAADVWEMNRMRTRVRNLFREALISGEAFLIVWPEPDTAEPVLYPQRAANCAVQYHDERVGYIIKAAKVWQMNNKYYRLNLYYPDRIEKYITTRSMPNGQPENASAFTPFEAAGESWPLPNPWDKVPVFHFPNGEDRDSELRNLIGAQNAINKTVCDQMIAMEFFAMPQRYAIGVEDNEDVMTDEERARYEKWKSGADRIWTLGHDQGKFGQFDPSDPNAFLAVKNDFRNDIAVLAGIPPYHFRMLGGDIPSGAALTILESRLTEKIEDLQGYWGDPLADAMRLALEMKGALPGGARLKTDWIDTTPHDPLAEAQTQEVKQRLGVSKRQSLGELGYSTTRIGEMEAEREDEQGAAGAMMGALFDRGAV